MNSLCGGSSLQVLDDKSQALFDERRAKEAELKAKDAAGGGPNDGKSLSQILGLPDDKPKYARPTGQKKSKKKD